MSRLALWRRRSSLPWRWSVVVDGVVADHAMTRRAALRRRGTPEVWATVIREGTC